MSMKSCPISRYAYYIKMDKTSWSYSLLVLSNIHSLLSSWGGDFFFPKWIAYFFWFRRGFSIRWIILLKIATFFVSMLCMLLKIYVTSNSWFSNISQYSRILTKLLFATSSYLNEKIGWVLFNSLISFVHGNKIEKKLFHWFQRPKIVYSCRKFSWGSLCGSILCVAEAGARDKTGSEYITALIHDLDRCCKWWTQSFHFIPCHDSFQF